MVSVKPIVGFEGKYSITSDGRVISEPRKDKYGRSFGGLTLKYKLDRYGYPRVSLVTENRKALHRTIHRLVAQAFIENPLNLPTVNHKDGDKQNNDKSNLEWVSWKENTRHGWEMGLCRPYDRSLPWDKSSHQDRSRCYRKYHFYKEDVENIIGLRSQGFSQQAIADMVGIKQGTISQILNGKLKPQERPCSI